MRATLAASLEAYLGRRSAAQALQTPLRRVGAKGEGRFEPISWDQAITEIATRTREVVERHGAYRKLCLVCSGLGQQVLH